MIKAIGGLAMFFTSLSYSKLQDAFYRLKKFKLFLRYDQSKSSRIIGFLWEGVTKTAKKTILFKIYLHLHFSSNLLQNFTV